MDVADALYAEYGEAAGGGIRAGKQDPVFEGGNAYLKEKFPLLDYIKTAVAVRASSRAVVRERRIEHRHRRVEDDDDDQPAHRDQVERLDDLGGDDDAGDAADRQAERDAQAVGAFR